jgi:hypothetical protein
MSTNGRKRMPRGSGAASDAHPIPVHERVAILRVPESGAPFIEGRAVVREVARGPHCYLVQFTGDPLLKQRIVHPDYQADPERMLEILRDLWRASSTPEVSDFFPEDNT